MTRGKARLKHTQWGRVYEVGGRVHVNDWQTRDGGDGWVEEVGGVSDVRTGGGADSCMQVDERLWGVGGC